MGVRVSQVKPSNCFRLHPTSMISKHSTIPFPVGASKKISFTFHFWHKSFIPDDVKHAELLPNNSFEWKNVTIFGGQKSKHTLTLPIYFQRTSRPPNSQDLRPWVRGIWLATAGYILLANRITIQTVEWYFSLKIILVLVFVLVTKIAPRQWTQRFFFKEFPHCEIWTAVTILRSTP